MGIPAWRGPVTRVASVTTRGAARRSRRSAWVCRVMGTRGAGPGAGGIVGVTLAWCRGAASSWNKETWF